MNDAYITQEGFTNLQTELHELKTVRRREVAQAITIAKEQGDLSENAEYVTAKEEQRRTEEKIAEIEATVKHAQIITKSDNSQVDIGNTVVLKTGDSTREYQIVGSNEADPLKGKISNESPMGKALLHKKKGDEVTIPTPAGDKQYNLVTIK